MNYEGYDDKYDEWKDKSEIVDSSPVSKKGYLLAIRVAS